MFFVDVIIGCSYWRAAKKYASIYRSSSCSNYSAWYKAYDNGNLQYFSSFEFINIVRVHQLLKGIQFCSVCHFIFINFFLTSGLLCTELGCSHKGAVAVRQPYIRVVGLEETNEANSRGPANFTVDEVISKLSIHVVIESFKVKRNLNVIYFCCLFSIARAKILFGVFGQHFFFHF